jgi:ARG/rhodanese/phosphatase superfamily protein
MHRRLFLSLGASAMALMTLGTLTFGTGADAADAYRLSGPFVHDNLAIYLVHGKSAPGSVPLTLEEAMARKLVRVIETGTVSELQIENLGNEEVFVQSGDIVKGGKQDRALIVSLLLPPKSGLIPIASFCVEQGRWSARGREDVKTFATASTAVPSREAKIAMKAPQPAAAPVVTGGIAEDRPGAARIRTVPSARVESADRQTEVWRKVRKIQDSLSANVGAPVNSAQSQSSLQLALENEKLKDAQAAYEKALRGAGENAADVIGYVFAINGKLNSADIYPSNGLFKKMWPKLLKASVTEAIGDRNAGAEPLPASAAVLAFLDEARRGTAAEKPLTASLKLETRDGDKAFYFETRRASGDWVHRNYLAK